MTVTNDPRTFTPYSTIKPFFDGDLEHWAPEVDRDRVSAYQKYDEIYWSHTDVFKLAQRGDDDHPIYVPNPMTIVDTTAHFFMKGLKISSKNADGPLSKAMKDFMEREMFLSKFHVAKHSGVARGDFLLHLTADPTKPPGTRLSINTLDPAVYFPEFDDDDLERITAVNLVESILGWEEDPTKTVMRVQRYSYGLVGGKRAVISEQAIFEVQYWWNGKQRSRIQQVTEPFALDSRITTIPVYHFKNKDWQGQPFGSSELRGYERVQAGINQSASDEELALALEGLGVYATDSGPPVDENGEETDWVIAPGKVMELAQGGNFRRVEGINTVKPFQEHLSFLVDSLYEASATFRGGSVDATVAESGIALEIRFLPTSAKLEQRDVAGVDKLNQFWFDWRNWMFVYEQEALPELDAEEVEIVLGDKLPQNKDDILNVLNNMMDRRIISHKFYREQISDLYGIEFPEDLEAQIKIDMEEAFIFGQMMATNTQSADEDDEPNNKDRPNESAGTEAKQKTSDQTRR